MKNEFHNFEEVCQVKRKFCTKECHKKRGVIFFNEDGSFLLYIIFNNTKDKLPTLQQARKNPNAVYRDSSSFRPSITHLYVLQRNKKVYLATFYFEKDRLKAIDVDGKEKFWYCPLK